MTSLRSASLLLLNLLCPIAIQEGHGLGTGAVEVGREASIACAVGDAVDHSPTDRIRIPGACGHIGEAGRTADYGLALGAPQEGYDMCAGAVDVGREASIACAVGDAIFHAPEHGLIVVVCR